MARSGAGYPAGSRPQKEDPHIPSYSGGSTDTCGFDQKEHRAKTNRNLLKNRHPGLDPGPIFVSRQKEKMDSGFGAWMHFMSWEHMDVRNDQARNDMVGLLALCTRKLIVGGWGG